MIDNPLLVTVSQLNRYISGKFKSDENLCGIMIRGEISNFTNHYKTGHFYFTLKDKDSSVKAVMFRGYTERLAFMPESGMSVILIGDVQVFERDGVYQIYVHDMQPDGLGAFNLAYEQLKEKLEKQGIFTEEHKLPIPSFPKKICLITAGTGAALQDMLNIIERRCPVTEAVLISALVQGKDAPESICSAIKTAQTTDCDLIIVGRGGGSIEDLWAFNSEAVAMAIYNSKIPVISAVGHQTDVTIADFAADLRAPTPSAAAELAVPDKTELIGIVDSYVNRIEQNLKYQISSNIDKTADLLSRLQRQSPEVKLEFYGKQLISFKNQINTQISVCLNNNKQHLAKNMSVISALSPMNVLLRGYSITYKNDKIVKSADEIKSGDRITVRFTDSSINAITE